MKRIYQTFEEISSSLIPIEASWLDAHAEEVILLLRGLKAKKNYSVTDVAELLDSNFSGATTAIRLFLDMSKDDFTHKMREFLGAGGIGVKRYEMDSATYLGALDSLGLTKSMSNAVNAPLAWSDILVERLKGGRGSAIKGQTRGRGMEDFVEQIVRSVFDSAQVAVRCRFTASKSQSTEKSDFAIPNANDPAILIEVKAYGATGSKQTDVLGDIARMVEEKRHDTVLLLVTDGITWKQRPSDLRKLVSLQNQGQIHRIYTKSMAGDLAADLQLLKVECGL
jgi:DpnII restriction endonuclease